MVTDDYGLLFPRPSLRLEKRCRMLYFDFCIDQKIRVVLFKGSKMLFYSLTVINIYWAYKAYKPILRCIPRRYPANPLNVFVSNSVNCCPRSSLIPGVLSYFWHIGWAPASIAYPKISSLTDYPKKYHTYQAYPKNILHFGTHPKKIHLKSILIILLNGGHGCIGVISECKK